MYGSLGKEERGKRLVERFLWTNEEDLPWLWLRPCKRFVRRADEKEEQVSASDEQ